MATLRSILLDEPCPLQFGTSGRRGRLAALTQLEIYLNVLGELRYLQSQPSSAGGIRPGDEFYIGHDLRPSSTAYVADPPNRGEICQAVDQAVRDAGMRPVHLGAIPTPAVAHFAWSRAKGSIMVTGSHIPFEWNGYKLNTARGELLKHHEAPIGQVVAAVRNELYHQAASVSPFDAHGLFKTAHRDLPNPIPDARCFYVRRYMDFFAARSLAGMRILVYQHTAVARDLLCEILEAFGAEVIPAGRSQTFVPIDTENIDARALAAIQQLADAVAGEARPDAVVSTDGDADRPLILGVDRRTGALRFFPGDALGMLTAEFLGADAAVVPISCNDAIDRGRLAPILEPKTCIGSPYVVAGMEAARARGRTAVCGWEPNGGFLVGSDIVRDGRTLAALPTRDAVLPLLSVLFAAREQGLGLPDLFAQLPPRYTASTLIRNFPRTLGLRMVEEFPPAGLEPVFGPLAAIDRTDGLRLSFRGGDVVHLRPSGNADEFRIYACADSRERAAEITRLGTEAVGAWRRQEVRR